MRAVSRWLTTSVIFGALLQNIIAQALEPVWKAGFDSATEHIARGEFAAAEALLKNALELARVLGPNSIPTGSTLNSLGVVYQHLARPAQAEHCYRRALAIWEGTPGADGLGLVRILDNLSRLYIESGRVGDAERMLRRALATPLEATPQSDFVLAKTHEYLFIVSFMRRDYADAEAHSEKTLELCERSLGSRHPETAIAWNDRGVLEIATGRYAEGIAHLAGSLQLLEDALTAHHPGLVRVLANLAWAYSRAQQPEQAEPLLQRALQIAEVSFGPTDIRTAEVLSKYADVLRNLDRKTEARHLQKRLKAISSRKARGNPMRLAIDVGDLR